MEERQISPIWVSSLAVWVPYLGFPAWGHTARALKGALVFPRHWDLWSLWKAWASVSPSELYSLGWTICGYREELCTSVSRVRVVFPRLADLWSLGITVRLGV